MGKSNRIRTQRAERVVVAPQQTKEKKGAPSWLYPVIALVVMVGVVLGVAVSLVSTNGIMFRAQKAVKSENYAIPGTVLQYMFIEQCNSFITNNQSTLSLYGLDPNEHLEHQKYTLDDTSGDAIDTWHDYFIAETVEQANEILIYCEEADKRGIKLEESDLASVESTIDQISMMVSLYNSMGYTYTLDSYISSMYGSGIKEKDIRNYLELYTLATKCAAVVGEELMTAITSDRIDAKYAENNKDYNVVDYDMFSKRVSYSDVQKELFPNVTELSNDQTAEVLAEYEKRVLAAAELQEKFADAVDIETFESMLLDNAGGDAFDASYKSEALADADKFSEEDLKTVRNSVISNALDDIEAGLNAPTDDTVEADGKITVYGIEITENTAKAIKNIKQAVFNAINEASSTYILENIYYSESSEVIKWAFDNDTANSVKEDESGDVPADGKVENKSGYYQAYVYMLKTPEHRDEMISKNMSYMTFTSEESAKKAIELLGAFDTVDATTFLSVAATAAASDSGSYESYLKGDSTYTELDKWIFDASVVKGSYTKTPLLLSESETSKLYGVFLYEDDSDAAWYLAVKSAIYGEDADAKYAELVETYPVTVNEKVTNKVSA